MSQNLSSLVSVSLLRVLLFVDFEFLVVSLMVFSKKNRLSSSGECKHVLEASNVFSPSFRSIV